MLVATFVLELTMALFRPEPTYGSMVRVFTPTTRGHFDIFSFAIEHVLAFLNPLFVITTIHRNDGILS